MVSDTTLLSTCFKLGNRMTVRELGLKKVVLEELFDVLEIKPEEIEVRNTHTTVV